MIVYLAGGVSGNLAPAWHRMCKRNDLSKDSFLEALVHENFWRVGNLGIGCMRFRT